jgi:hypothetical protein
MIYHSRTVNIWNIWFDRMIDSDYLDGGVGIKDHDGFINQKCRYSLSFGCYHGDSEDCDARRHGFI